VSEANAKRQPQGRERNCEPASTNLARGGADEERETSELSMQGNANRRSCSDGLWSCLGITVVSYLGACNVFLGGGRRNTLFLLRLPNVARTWGDHCVGNLGFRLSHF
jgi:hypothetical protein